MSAFTTRVELHGYASAEDYQRLHQAMEAAGFQRTIKGSNGKWYHLPTAEYYISGAYTADQVREMAAQAAARTGKEYSILVSISQGCYWQNLKEVKQPTYNSLADILARY
jgi:hypothetical protein